MKKRLLAMMSATVLLFANSLTVSATTFKSETTAPTTTTMAINKPRLTLEDVIELSKKGNELTWSDFEKYEFEDIGSGLYINKYDLEDDYTLLVGGVPEESPYYILLYRNNDEKNGIDIRTEDVEAFLNIVSIETTTFKPETTAPTTTTTAITKPRLTLDDVIELSKKGNELTWSDFEKYEFKDIGSGLYIEKYVIEYDYTLLVGGIPEKSPYYILLYRNDNEENRIDIRTEDVKAFLYGDIRGDVNADGVFSVADVILLQKWLLSTSDTKLANWKAADFCEDGTLDVFDLCLMKKALIETSSTQLRKMTKEDFIELAKKGDELTWADFAKYQGNDIGSGLFVVKYEIADNDEFFVLVCGEEMDGKPGNIIWVPASDDSKSIDIRSDEFQEMFAL